MKKFILPFAIGLIMLSVSSCNIYGVVAEDDVYVQGPSKLNLQEDPNDMTTFNSYRAGRQGRFQTQYNTPRRNTSIGMMAGFGNPWGPTMGMHSGWGMNHGWGMNSWGHNPWHNPWGPSWGMHGGWAMNHGWGMNPVWGMNSWGYNPWGPSWGMNSWGYNSWHNPWSPSWGMNSWGYNSWHNPWGPSWGMHGHGGWGNNPWYGGGGFTGVHPGANNPPQNVFRGPRRSYSSNSGRSSTYPSTIKSGSIQTNSGNATDKGQTIASSSNEAIRNRPGAAVRTVTPIERAEFVRPGVQSSTLAASRGNNSNMVISPSIDRNNLQRNNLVGVNNSAANVNRAVANNRTNASGTIRPSNVQSSRINNQLNRPGAITTSPYRPSSSAVRKGSVSRSQVQRSTGFQNSRVNPSVQNRGNVNRPGASPSRNRFDTPPRSNNSSRPSSSPNRSNFSSPSRGNSISSPSRGTRMSSPSRGSSMSSPSRGSMSSPSRGGGSRGGASRGGGRR